MSTAISWTQGDDGKPGETWNPVIGCSMVSAGCTNCYAMRQAARIERMGGAGARHYKGLTVLRAGEPKWSGEVRFIPERLVLPLQWSRGRRVFVNSMSDLFHEDVTNEQIAAVFGVMTGAKQHTFQLLTKRAERMRDWFRWAERADIQSITCGTLDGVGFSRGCGSAFEADDWPLPNVWLGVSVENQAAADERIPFLLETPAAVRFLSCEPLLGPVDVSEYLDPASAPCGETNEVIDWIIAGCESGPGARPADVDWFRSLRDQCAAAGVPFFLKQAMPGAVFVAGPGDGHRGVTAGAASRRKAGGVIELPNLDGVPHAAFPEVRP